MWIDAHNCDRKISGKRNSGYQQSSTQACSVADDSDGVIGWRSWRNITSATPIKARAVPVCSLPASSSVLAAARC